MAQKGNSGDDTRVTDDNKREYSYTIEAVFLHYVPISLIDETIAKLKCKCEEDSLWHCPREECNRYFCNQCCHEVELNSLDSLKFAVGDRVEVRKDVGGGSW